MGNCVTINSTFDEEVEFDWRKEIEYLHSDKPIQPILMPEQQKTLNIWILSCSLIDKRLNQNISKQERHTLLLDKTGIIIELCQFINSFSDLTWENTQQSRLFVEGIVIVRRYKKHNLPIIYPKNNDEQNKLKMVTNLMNNCGLIK